MSTSESETSKKGSCPCGNGQITAHRTTQDNPWSGADVSYSIECVNCKDQWRLENYTCTLVRLASEVKYIAAQKKRQSVELSFTKTSEELINQYFALFSAKNKKIEHAEIERLKLTSLSYRQYLAHRRKGDSIASCCHGQKNKEWLFEQANKVGKQKEIEDAFNAYEATMTSVSDAARLIERWRVA